QRLPDLRPAQPGALGEIAYWREPVEKPTMGEQPGTAPRAVTDKVGQRHGVEARVSRVVGDDDCRSLARDSFDPPDLHTKIPQKEISEPGSWIHDAPRMKRRFKCRARIRL